MMIHARTVWDHFQIQNLAEYSNLFIKCEKYRNLYMKGYGLDPANYYSCPGFAWDAMLKFTKVELELLI